MALPLKTTKVRIGLASLFAILTPPTVLAVPMLLMSPPPGSQPIPGAMLINYLAVILALGVAPLIVFIPGWIAFHRRGLRWRAAAVWGSVFGVSLALVAYLGSWLVIGHNFKTLQQFIGVALPAGLIMGAVDGATAVGVWWIAYKHSPTPKTVAASFD
jgi:hypothetical protein